MAALAMQPVAAATLALSSASALPLAPRSSSLLGPCRLRSPTVQFSRRCTLPVTRASALGSQGDGNVKEIQSKADFDEFLRQAGDRLVVVDVATKTCGPCKFIYPKVVQLSLDYSDVVFLKIFGDLNEETRLLMREWGVRAVPLFRFYRGGVLVHSHTGAKEEELRKNVEVYHSQPVPA